MKYKEENKIKVKVLHCIQVQYIGEIVEVYNKYSNGVDFITPLGLEFLTLDEFEIVEF